MKNFYFNLNQLPSKNDGGQSCDGNRQSRLMLQSGCGAVDVPMTSYGAPDEHPMSIRSASDGERWQNRVWKYVAMIFAVLVMSVANVGMAWADDYVETYNPPTTGAAGSAGMGAFSVIGSVTGDVSFGNSSLQIGTNAGSGTFVVASKDGSYIKSITFTETGDDYKASTFTSSDGEMSYKSKVWTFTPSTATKTSCSFSLSAPSSKKVRLSPIVVNLTSNYEYFTKNFSVSSGTVSGTKSNASTDVTLTTTGSASSNYLTVNSGKTLTITSSGHNIKSVHFVFQNHASVTVYSASTGTYNSNSWTAGDDTQTVTFSSTNNTTIAGISVELADLGVTYTVTAATDNASYGTATATKTTVAEGSTTTITATPKSGYAFHHWTVSGTGATLSSTTTNPTTLTMGTANATVTAYFVVDPCSAWGYGTANTTAPSSGNSVTVGDLTVANVGCSTSSTTPFSGGTSTGVILGNGASKYITGTLGGDEIESIRFSIYTTDAAKPTYVVAFSSSATYDAATVLKVSGDNTAYFYDDAPVASGTRKDVEVTAPAGAKSFAIGRNLSGVSHGGTEQNSGSRGVYYIAACPADEPSCPTPTASRGGTEALDAAGVPLGTVVSPLTCTATGTSVTYQWKQNTSGTKDGAVNAVGTGATTASFVPNPDAVGSYWYYCIVTDACSNSVETSLSGMFKFNAACTAPNHVDVTGTYHFFPGETIELTARAYSTTGTSNEITEGLTYQWQKYIGSEWSNLSGETSATYTKANATTSDVGQYQCIVSTGTVGDACSTTSTPVFNVKCLQLYWYYDDNSDCGNIALSKVSSTIASASINLVNESGYSYRFKVTDGCGNWYGNTGEMNSSNCTDWNLDADAYTRLKSSGAGTYTFKIDYTDIVHLVASVQYPKKQIAGYPIYFEKPVSNWTNAYYRVGANTTVVSDAALSLVNGTARLYTTTTKDYTDFNAWHICNNTGWAGSNHIYRTYTNDDSYSITYSTDFDGIHIGIAGVTVVMKGNGAMGTTTSGDDRNDNCRFYNFDRYDGLWTHIATIGETINGSIHLNWTDINGAAQNSTSTTSGLAHTCNLTITAVPDAGYELASLTVNGEAFTSGNVHVLSADATIAATFSCITPAAPAEAKISTTPSCAGTGATFSADVSDVPSYITWYWQTSADGTSTSYPASSDYTTATAAGTYTMYLRAKNTVCNTWSNSASSPSKSVKVKEAVTASWNTAPADGTVGGSMTASVTTNYSAGLVYSVSSASPAGCVTVNSSTGAISYVAAGTATVTATVTGAGDDYCSSAVINQSITVTAAGPSYTAPASVLDIAPLTSSTASNLITKYYASDNNYYLSTNTDTLLLIPSDIYYNISNGKENTWAAADGTPTTTSAGWSKPDGSQSFKGNSWWKSSGNINTLQVRSDRTLNIRVTGCKTVSVLNAAAGDSKYFIMEAYEYSGGYVSADPAVSASNTSTSVTETSLSLTSSKEYVIVLRGNNENNNKIYEIKFIAEAATYTITYKHGDGGATGDDVEVSPATTIGGKPVGFTAPTGKTFVRWNTAANGSGTNYYEGDPVTSDLTLHAQWGYVLTYDANAGGDAVSNLPDPEPHMPEVTTLSSTVPTRSGYTFNCWNRNTTGTGDCFSAGGAFTMGAENQTLYAKWTEDECTPTTLFSMVVADSGSDADVARQGGTLSLTTSNHLSTLTGGSATLKNNYASTGSAHKMVGKDNDERHLRFKQNDHLLIVTLDEALAEGDIISFTGYGSNQLSFTTTETRATTPATSSKSYTIPSASGLIGATTIYIWRSSGSDTYIKSLTITRPCDESAEACKTPNITNIASTTNMTTAETKSLNVTLGNPGALTGTVSYAWTNADGSAIAAAAKATGTTTARLTLAEPEAGTYTFKCTVTNDCGGDGSQSATSAVFTVVVTASTGCPEIAKVIVSSASAGTGSGTKIAETGGYGVNLEDTPTTDDGKTGYKIGSSKYVYLQLANGEQFQNGDKVKVYITNLSDQGDHNLHIFQGTTAAGTEVATVESPALGWNEATLSGVTSGQRSLTIHRSSGTTEQNHGIYAFAVERCVDCTPATHEGLAYTKTSYTVGETATALTVTNPENADSYQWYYNTVNDRSDATKIAEDDATSDSFMPSTTAAFGTRYYWCELTNDCGTVKTSAVGITVSAVLTEVTVTWTNPAGTVNYGGGGYTITAQVTPAAWDGTLTASMLTAPDGIRIYDVEINNTAHTLQAKFDVQTSFDREANATAIPFALTLAATANYGGKIDEHNVAYSACAAGGGGGILFSQNFNDATEVAYTANTAHEITTSSSNNIVGNTAASQFTLIKNNQKSNSGIAINSETGANSKDATGFFQAYYPTTGGKYALVKNTDFAATAPGAISVAMDIWFKQGSSGSEYSVTFAVGDGFSNSYDKPNSDKVHSGFSIYNNSAATLTAYASSKTNISTAAISQGSWITITWVINNTGDDLEYTNPAGTKSTLANDKFDVWVGTTQFVSGQAATTASKTLQNLYIGDPNGKNHEFRLDNVKVTDISTNSGTGSIATALTWSNGKADGATLTENEGTADFAVTADRDAVAATSLGAITYSSSDASVATVNETTGQVHIADNIDFGGEEYKTTTITATLAASGCYKRAEITYVLSVKKRACADVAGTVTSNTVGCTTTLTLSGYTDGATIQWYKDGASLGSADGAQTATYVPTSAGDYYAVTTKNCDRTSNTVTVTSTAVSATKIVDEWYVKNGRRTPDIALVQTENAIRFTVTTGSPASDITSTGIGGCGFYLGTDGIIYLKGAKNDGTAPSDMTEGDTEISITAKGCTDATPVTITIHRQVETDKYVLAYVVTGDQDGGWTQNPPANQTTGVELYRTLTNHFDVQATNIYATTDEQKIKEYYSRYDIIFITDYPNTKTKNGTTKKSYVDALGAMIDIRPILTMEAWVSGLSNWSAKGVAGSPKSPTTRQYNMLLQCKDHEIFSSTTVETIGEGDDVKFKINMVDSTKVLYDTLDTKYGAGAHAEKTGYCYGKHPALQGFVYDEALADMLPLGLIDDGAGNNLQVGLERQKEMEARMMVLGINADAMERLSKDGETVIVNALKYLMKKDAEDIMDCSIYFDNAGGDHLWNNVANWGPSHLTLPQPTQEARILQPCIVNSEANAASIKIISGGKYNHGSTNANGSLTIAKSGILKVGGRIVAASAPNYYEVRPTDASRLVVEADKVQTGALIHGHKSGELNATVQLVSKAYSERVEEGGKIKTKKYWQYVGLPVQEALAEEAFYGGYTYKYEESAGWKKKRTGDMLEEFWGIGLSYDNDVLGKDKGSPITFNISGALALATNRDIELTKTAGVGEGENMIGNSWTAPIHLVNMTDEDFENATATIYLFNTGRSAETAVAGEGDNDTPGQWRTIPVATSKLTPWKGPKVIPAMQAFEVDVADDATSGTLHLNYDKHVRNIATATEEHAPLLAPKRYMSEEPSMMRLRVADTATYTDLYLIEGEQLSDEFDNGWDGKYQQCDGRSATLYALSPIGNMAVLAQQSVNNTAVVFRPGRQSEYTFTFGYDGEVTYYLNDLLLEKSTEIREGNEYRFTYNEGDMESRFVVSSTPFESPNVTTGTGGVEAQEKVQKVVYKDHVYIIRGGKIYDVMGKMMK